MTASPSQKVEIRCWHYSCPECGFSDKELGHLATDDEVHCMVCVVETESYVRLRRWAAEEAHAATPGSE